jgi:hypothetical protein
MPVRRVLLADSLPACDLTGLQECPRCKHAFSLIHAAFIITDSDGDHCGLPSFNTFIVDDGSQHVDMGIDLAL